MELKDKERKKFVEDFIEFDMPWAMSIWINTVTSVLEEIKKTSEESEDNKAFQEFMIDAMVCFIPFSSVLKKFSDNLNISKLYQINEKTFENLGAASSELTKFVTKKAIPKDKSWDTIDDYKVNLELTFGLKIRRLYDFMKENVLNRKLLPDEVLLANCLKYNMLNFTSEYAKTLIINQIKQYKKFVLSFKNEDHSKIGNHVSINFLLRLISSGPNVQTTYLPVLETYISTNAQYYWGSPNAEQQKLLSPKVINECIPPSLVEMSLSQSLKQKTFKIGRPLDDHTKNILGHDFLKKYAVVKTTVKVKTYLGEFDMDDYVPLSKGNYEENEN